MEYVTYPLDTGFIGNWLVAGPLVVPVNGDIAPEWECETGIDGAAVERGPLGSGVFHAGPHSGVWVYHACPADHVVDHSGTFPRHRYLRSWAYAELVTSANTPQAVDLVLTAYGPAGVWLNEAAVFQTQTAGTHAFSVELDNDVTPLLVRFERLSRAQTAHAMSLRVSANDIHVRLPTLIPDIGRRNAFEKLTSDVYVERDVYEGDTPIVVRWPEGERAFCPAHVRLHSAVDSIYALADAAGAAGDALQLGCAMQLPAGPFRVTLIPSPDEVYLKDTRISVHVPLWSMGRQRYSALPSGDPSTRGTEALLAVAEHAGSPFAQIARMALGAWDDVEVGVLQKATENVRRGEDGSNVVLVALLGMLYRWGDHARFPQEVRQPLDDAVVRCDYGGDEPSESGRILWHCSEILAGQRYPERTFGDGHIGTWHRSRAERLAGQWMTAFGTKGTAEWGAPDAMEHDLVALSHLTDLADSTHVYELAAVCLDKLLFNLALNSRQGVLGSAARTGPPSFVRSGYCQPTAGISRLLWGSGIYNHHVAGVLSLACTSGYDPPPILEAIAHDAPAELCSHERHAARGAEPTDIHTYKTPDYILSSVSSLAPTSKGESELMWRVTLGPEAMVFANHPGSSSESIARLPGYWAGNMCLPRVAQWKDVLVSMHRLPTDDVFGFTHAYFPCATFDEYALHDRWAFARSGDGYLALANSRGLSMTAEGRYAQRELRAWGNHQTWVVQMGRAALDGDFSEFQHRVLAMAVSFSPEAVQCTTLRRDVLRLAWSGPLTVNDEPQLAHGSKHFDNAYTTTELPCTQMEIRHGLDYLRLDFAE